MRKIRLTQEAYIEGYDGAFLREVRVGTNEDLDAVVDNAPTIQEVK